MMLKLSLFRGLTIAALITVLTVAAGAQIRLPGAISDHAVLQRERPIHIWGWSSPDAHLTAHFHAQTISAVSNDRGEWSLYLQPESAGGPYTLQISGDGPAKTVTDLLVGDVWVASGQSNMEFPLKGFGPGTPMKNQEQEIAAATNPKLRLLLIEHKASDFPVDDAPSHWTTCTPETAQNFSAVAYFFGREIASKENVPVGLVDSTWGGTPADSWVSMDTLGTNAQLLPAFASRAKFADQQADLDATIAAEKREDASAKAAGKPAPSHQWHPYEASWLPAGLYNGMIAPLSPMSIKGFIWYQGETNSSPERARFYHSLFAALIGDWRMHFAQGNLPFLFVQISSFTSPGENWGMVRDQQRRTLDVADTAMAVTLDIGNPDNVHPADKQDVGARLALAARHVAYNEAVDFAGPLFSEATTEPAAANGLAMRVWFNDAAGLSSHDRPVSGFELAGADHHFIPAEAMIQGETVRVTATGMPHPKYVRYGWASVVPDNLFNSAGLPASTFTSEAMPTK